jgi:hypothetical protein
LVNNNQKGPFIFTDLLQVKQYQYATNNQMTQYELVKFCDRYDAYDAKQVCCIIKYCVTKQGNNYLITRHNDPANEFSDGTFTLGLDDNEDLRSISFKTFSNKGDWQRIIDLNEGGNVNCYTDKSGGIMHSTTCMVYHNEPKAKYPVETIITTYEKDGTGYKQNNITTEKKRVRDELTNEWGPWK